MESVTGFHFSTMASVYCFLLSPSSAYATRNSILSFPYLISLITPRPFSGLLRFLTTLGSILISKASSGSFKRKLILLPIWLRTLSFKPGAFGIFCDAQRMLIPKALPCLNNSLKCKIASCPTFSSSSKSSWISSMITRIRGNFLPSCVYWSI